MSLNDPYIVLITAIIGSTAFTEIVKLIKSLIFNKKDKQELQKTEKQVKLLDFEVQEASIDADIKRSDYYKESYAQVIKRLGEVEEELKKTQEQLKRTNELLKINNDQVKKMKTEIRTHVKTIKEKEKELTVLRKRCIKEDCINKQS